MGAGVFSSPPPMVIFPLTELDEIVYLVALSKTERASTNAGSVELCATALVVLGIIVTAKDNTETKAVAKAVNNVHFFVLQIT